jgi:hypothetical protein
MQTCRDSALGNEVGSFTTCATLLFAAIGVMNRMRFSSDAPIQKLLGMVRARVLVWVGFGWVGLGLV